MIDNFISLKNLSNVHFFGSGSIIDINQSEIHFDSISTNILLFCDGTRRINEISNAILHLYECFSLSSDKINKINSDIGKFILRQIELGNLEGHTAKSKLNINITGERGKYYPKRVVLELTSFCNLRCSHCFRDAGKNGPIFLSKIVCEDLIQRYNKKIYEIQVTGGEPLLHPDFIEVVSKLSECFRLILMTNATMVGAVNDDVLEKVDFIQTSLYGVDKQSFSEITNSSNSLFDKATSSIKRINNLNIDNQIVFMINDIIRYRLEECIRLAISLGVKNLKFGLASPIGRATLPGTIKWIYSPEEINEISRDISILSDKYADNIDVYKWKDDYYNVQNCFKLHPDMPRCGAGYTHICITDTNRLKSCQFLTEAFLLDSPITIDDLAEGGHVNQDVLYRKLANDIYNNNFDPHDVCTLISDIYDDIK